MKVLISNDTDFDITPYIIDFEKIIEFALKSEEINTNVEVSISVVDNNTIQDINKRFRHIDKPTDVLSFPLIEDFNVDFSQCVLIGDIIISIDKVLEQSKGYNHSIRREICFLVAHSIYHLLGYDHMNRDDEKEMFEKQEFTLNELEIYR